MATPKEWRRRGRSFGLLALIVCGVLLGGAGFALADIGGTTSATLTATPYYASVGTVVQLSGTGMAANEAVTVDVNYPDGSLAQEDGVQADASGNFSDSYTVQATDPSGIFTVTATGQQSGLTASATFDPAVQADCLQFDNPGQFDPVTPVVGLDSDGVGVDISWLDQCSNEQHYIVQRSTSSSGPWTDVATLDPVAGQGGTGSYEDTSAGAGNCGTTYYYRIEAIVTNPGNDNQTSFSDVSSGIIVACPETPTVSTQIHRHGDSTTDYTGSSVGLGSVIFDTASVSTVTNDIPAGSSVTFKFYSAAGCTGSYTSESKDLTGGSTSESVDSSETSALHPGSYSYLASFVSGNTNLVASGDATCENVTVNQATPDVATGFEDSSNAPVTSPVALGTNLHDAATVTGIETTGFNPTGTVSFTFYGPNTGANASSCTASATNPSTAEGSHILDGNDPGSADGSNTVGPLHAGYYAFQASYPGNTDYGSATSPCESLTVNKADTTTTTQVLAGTTDVTGGSVPPGVTIIDRATVTSTNTSGFSFAGTSNIVYKLYSGACGTGSLLHTTTGNYPSDSDQANTSGSPLAVGSYCFRAQYLGNGDYNGSTAADENFTVVPTAAVTDSSLCTFAEDGVQNQFRLIYTPDIGAPTYKLNASNPGQFYYNVFHFGSAGPVSINIPAPFVTQGTVATHVYSGVTVTGTSSNFCLTPGTLVGQSSTQVTSTSSRTITVNVPAGFSYITIHLDYGYKGLDGCTKDSTTLTATCGTTSITSPKQYAFDGVSPAVQSENVFKKDPGIGGLVTQASTGNPVVGTTVKIYDGSNKLLGTVTTDSDGWYMWAYKYTGKAATFVVKLPAYNQSQTVTLKSNSFLVVNFGV
jgi:hypothetical protein